MMIWLSHVNSMFPDPYYKNIYIKSILQLTDNLRNKESVGARGTNPATGDYYPVKFFASAISDFSQSICPGQKYWTIKPFQDAQIRQGMAVYLRDVLSWPADTATINQIKTMSTDGLFYQYTYGYKTPDQVRNKTPNLSDPNLNINEGGGGFNDYYCMIVSTNPAAQYSSFPFNAYTSYRHTQQEEIYPGYCNELIMASELRKLDSTYLMSGGNDLLAEYFQKFSDAFKRVWIVNPYENKFYDKSNWSVNPTKMEDEHLCGIALALGVPNGAGGAYVNGSFQANPGLSCPDADNDGVTTCGGDCNDANPSIRPNRGENCTTAADDNCNQLVNCDDPYCSELPYSGTGPSGGGTNHPSCQPPSTQVYCGNHTINSGETCDAVPSGTGAINGLGAAVNGCGPIPNNPTLDPAYNATAVGYCTPAFVAFANGCTCSTPTLFLSSITSNPSLIVAGQSAALTLNGTLMQNGDGLRITKENSSPAVNVNLTISQTGGTFTTTLPATGANSSTTLGAGNHSAKIVQGSSTSNSINFQIVNATDLVLSSITPSSAVNNQNSPLLTLNGYIFQSGDQAEFTGTSGTVTKATTFVNNTSLTTSLTIAEMGTLGLGPGTVRVKCGPAHTCAAPFSGAQSFSITSPTLPSLAQMTIGPAALSAISYNDISPWITLDGANLNNAVVKVGSVTVPSSQVSITSSSSLRFQLKQPQFISGGNPLLPPSATPYPVTVTVGSNVSNSLPLMVSPPVLNDLNPTTIPANTAGSLQLQVEYYANPLIHIGSYPALAPTSTDHTNQILTLDLSQAQVSAIGAGTHDVRLENTGYFSQPISLTIGSGGGPGVPVLSGVSPPNIGYASPTSLILSGSNFTSPATVKIGTFTIPSAQVAVNSPTQITATLTAANTTLPSLDVSTYNVTVTQASGTSGAQSLTIWNPQLASVIPSSIEFNFDPVLDLACTFYGTAPMVSVGSLNFTPTIPVAGTLRVDPTLANVNNQLGVGIHNVIVTNTLKQSTPRTLTITDPIPTLTMVNPNSIEWDLTHSITLTGTKFQSATPVYAGSKVNVGALTNISPTSVNANNLSLAFSLSAAQTKTLDVGTHQVHVVNGSQTSSAIDKTITIIHAIPLLNANGISPNPIVDGQDYSITLTGSKIHPAAQILIGNPTILVRDNTGVNGANTQLTFNLTSANIANTLGGPGTYPIRIRNAQGFVSTSQDLTINASSGGPVAPGVFSVIMALGAAAGDANVSWTLAGGTSPVQYIIRGIPKSHAIAQDGNITSTEFENTNAGEWSYAITDPANPFVFSGTPGIEYCFAGKAANTAGSSYSTTDCGFALNTQSAPGAFTLNGSTGADVGTIDLSWTNSGGVPVPRYYLRGVLNSDPIVSDGTISLAEFDEATFLNWVVSTQTSSPYLFTGVPNSIYCFAVQSKNIIGSTLSNTSCVRAKENPPPVNPPANSSNGGGGGGGGGGPSTGGNGGNNLVSCQPAIELCDGIDNDCDAQVDEGCAQTIDSSTCFNGLLDEGESDVDCGGICTQWCANQNPVPSSFYGFLTVAASPLLLFVQFIINLLGGSLSLW